MILFEMQIHIVECRSAWSNVVGSSNIDQGIPQNIATLRIISTNRIPEKKLARHYLGKTLQDIFELHMDCRDNIVLRKTVLDYYSPAVLISYQHRMLHYSVSILSMCSIRHLFLNSGVCNAH